MLTIFFGIFLILHGLVHLLYAGQSGRLYELSPGLTWPDGSWLFSRWPGNEPTRLLATGLLALVALGFIAGGLGLLYRQEGWHPTTVGVTVISAVIFLLLWNGRLPALDQQGGVGMLLSLAVLAAVLILKGLG